MLSEGTILARVGVAVVVGGEGSDKFIHDCDSFIPATD